MSFLWRELYPHRDSEYLGHLVSRYAYSVELSTRTLTKNQAVDIEQWCEQTFGKLDETNPESPWQVSSFQRKVKDRIGFYGFEETLIFHFWTENDTIVFKLTWGEFLYSPA